MNKFAILFCLLIACTSQYPGYLEGTVTIGPICPVEREDQPCTTPPEAYEARKIMIYSGNKLAKQVDIDSNGYYNTELSPGRYTVDINKIGIDHAEKQEITIKSDKTVVANFDIDTGIR